LTGHKGERVNRSVALVTDDFRLYHKLVPFLEGNGLRVLVLKPGDAVPAAVQVLLGGPSDDPRTVPLRPDFEATFLAALAALDPRLRRPGGSARRPYHRVVFGLDPGRVTGVAVLADGELFLVGESLSVEAAVERVASWATAFETESWAIHVGAGAPEVGRALLQGLRQRLPHARASLVGEEKTTPYSHVTGSRHTDAAVHIALREPPA
jgi:hypothetical protein